MRRIVVRERRRGNIIDLRRNWPLSSARARLASVSEAIKINIGLVIRQADVQKAVAALHAHFF
jgi:hypothetical protein